MPGVDDTLDPRPPSPGADAEARRPGRPSPSSPVLLVGLDPSGTSDRRRLIVRLAEVAAALAFALVTLHPGGHGGTLAVIGVALSLAAWLSWIAAGDRLRAVAPALMAMAAAGGMTAAVRSSGLVFLGVAAGRAAFCFELPIAVSVALPALIAYIVTAVVRDTFPDHLSTICAIGLFGILSGAARRQLVAQGRRAALVSTADRRAALAWRETELVTERSRMARDLHDVLAHTLGAVSIQLTALDSRVAAGDDPASLRERIGDVHRLVGEGLGEARDAVRALRADGLPLGSALQRLTELHGASLHVDGDTRPLSSETAFTLYRVAQEALTNADKHAPRAPVSMTLSFHPQSVAIRIDSGHGDPDVDSPLASSGAGHGLAGMRERVGLAGGRLDAGPVADGWRVSAEIATDRPPSR